MVAQIIDGKALAARLRDQVRTEVEHFKRSTGRPIGLATVLVGDDPASEVYVNSKRKLSRETGIQDHHRRLPANATQEQVAQTLDELANDPAVSGILLQLPLPAHLDAKALIDRIPWNKDVDGLTTTSAGRLARNIEGLIPCTPAGVMSLLEDEGVQLQGAHAVVVGRSDLVGKPLAQLLLQKNATVTIAHSKTKDLAATTHQAQILIAAAGVPHLIGAEHIAPGTVVIDVGIHRTPEGLIGDVDFNAAQGKASRITPVPGGVGPMTIAELLRNTLKAAWLQS
ncbi:bifunctional methylenetetrahydrofolate dehydrogenase/methenyltetrahydrofolate cyclohydrolase FolD [Arthrobacter sp. YN]|uniref:bifunctional methylenetetrahydrofolate dehydrogenase/methenyltetrahydrofolate cyclohydrolase FolD n=1 Tax=Arthrobacter sp. YN TaxID=2020486 RepID=UPI000B5F1A72|nr:bifunctional methylenetetrahydrofolate dehydrogenase/methenyltetrahydrofolate cyclohydrolase FolD [Arthrobacter sp. YN]ASN20154.1 bifunctional 5,10-methylene-tetrahydrofolate dehydrogenase/5,10-methylene-tetrahydrofolate cyclohydrolase [Arthrobacter sp. YN]